DIRDDFAGYRDSAYHPPHERILEEDRESRGGRGASLPVLQFRSPAQELEESLASNPGDGGRGSRSHLVAHGDRGVARLGCIAWRARRTRNPTVSTGEAWTGSCG